jgi:hypothetical protein
MAYVARLSQPEHGMEEYLNVGAKVGGDPDCPNNPSDVEAVQRLIALILRGTSGVKLGVPSPSRQFDAVTGYHIFNIQHFVKKKRPGTIVDGCVSPARGVSYGGGVYCILNSNAMARANDKDAWQSILERFRPTQPGQRAS